MSDMGMPWFCELCGASGVLPAGWGGIEGLSAHGEASPDCPGGRDTVRCLPRFGEERDRWIRLGAQLQFSEAAIRDAKEDA